MAHFLIVESTTGKIVDSQADRDVAFGRATYFCRSTRNLHHVVPSGEVIDLRPRVAAVEIPDDAA